MRKIVFILILFLFIPTVSAANNDLSKDEFETLASLIMHHDLSIKEWQVTKKEKVTQESLIQLMEGMKDQYRVRTEENDKAIKYIIEDTHKTAGLSVIYIGILPKEHRFDAEFTAIIKGEKWNKSIEDNYQKKRDFIRRHFFTNSVKTFTCLTTEEDAIIGNDRTLTNIVEQLGLTYVSTQNDKMNQSVNKKFIYGYTSLWSEKITVMDTPVNVQIAIKYKQNGDSNITIGTPILINEY
ncbi:YwmB family TATA-box binding protein [Virgibacillus alimentarius]|uniref:TATA-box binding protein n=1 Tax=Virgibacillus alimentarius TaxID=698769 RepID=A0ABS4S7D5_9BACI|nr:MULTISPECIES: YwmB family TATA-box binding protein [Virgibacillus]MBP2257380.1 hypothetical protein [Virgibacillus alimentarius]HLR67730.1 YwmB family TATA-box binding protein [Virgibacillus sp.]